MFAELTEEEQAIAKSFVASFKTRAHFIHGPDPRLQHVMTELLRELAIAHVSLHNAKGAIDALKDRVDRLENEARGYA